MVIFYKPKKRFIRREDKIRICYRLCYCFLNSTVREKGIQMNIRGPNAWKYTLTRRIMNVSILTKILYFRTIAFNIELEDFYHEFYQ